MSITTAHVEILSKLLELGYKEAAENLAHGLVAKTEDIVVTPSVEATAQPDEPKAATTDLKEAAYGDPYWAKDVELAARKSYAYLKHTLKGVDKITWSRSHGGGHGTTSEDAFFDISFVDGRDVTLVLSVIDHEYGDMFVHTSDFDAKATGYIQEIKNGDEVEDALKDMRKLWGWVGDGSGLVDSSLHTSAVKEETPEYLEALLKEGKVDEALALLDGMGGKPASKESDVKEAYGIQKQKLDATSVKNIKLNMRDSKRKFPRGFTDLRRKPLGMVAGQTVYFRDQPYLVYDFDAEMSAPRGVMAVLVAPDFSHLLRNVKVTDISMEGPQEAPSTSDSDDEYEYWASAKEKNASEEHEALKLRGEIREREEKFREKVMSFSNIALPDEALLMENPAKYNGKLLKGLELLDAVEKAFKTFSEYSAL